MSGEIRSASAGRAYEAPPQLTETGSRTWITRGANFVVAISEVERGAVLRRADNFDEYMVLLGALAATIRAGDETVEAAPESLTIVPPGPSEVTAKGAGHLVRVLSNRAADLLAQAENAAAYADGAPEVAPLAPWPDPPGGFRLRNYQPFDYHKADTNMRLFRCTNLMINVLTKRTAPRDVKKLSPHSHDDFEQASLLLEGEYIHHLRYPWVSDLSQWRPDEHMEIGSPSVIVIPPKVVHTSRNIGEKRSWLIDIFAPPRLDFSRKPGLVLNADDYPMPAGLQ
jgi:mannose-6-phosphate isomerase-like protein (cupin superfamily)